MIVAARVQKAVGEELGKFMRQWTPHGTGLPPRGVERDHNIAETDNAVGVSRPAAAGTAVTERKREDIRRPIAAPRAAVERAHRSIRDEREVRLRSRRQPQACLRPPRNEPHAAGVHPSSCLVRDTQSHRSFSKAGVGRAGDNFVPR